jgi:predicted amino acid-binding ACT domain protein
MIKNQNLLMVIVSGKDRPGITAKFARILMEHNVEVAPSACRNVV